MLKEFTTIYCNVTTRTGCMQWIFKWGSRPPEMFWGLFAFPPNINCLDMNKWRTHFWVLYSMSNPFLSQIGLCSWKSTDFHKPTISIHWKINICIQNFDGEKNLKRFKKRDVATRISGGLGSVDMCVRHRCCHSVQNGRNNVAFLNSFYDTLSAATKMFLRDLKDSLSPLKMCCLLLRNF